MRFTRALDEVLGQRSKVMLLRFLLRTGGEHSGRDLSRFLGLDHKTCHAALRALAAQGVVEARRLGTAVGYKLRTDHPVVRDILSPAFEREAELAARYVREAKEGSGAPAESVILYGSVARGQEAAGSDVDVLFVTRDRREKARAEQALHAVAAELAGRWGSAPQFIVEDLATFRRKALRRDPFHGEILRTGKVVMGKPFAELLKDGGKTHRQPKRPSR